LRAGRDVPLWSIPWTRTPPQVTLDHMNAPASHAPLPRASARSGPPRHRRRARRLVGVVLDGLRFTAMALVGMLGVWLLVLLFG
jgi:hypothetical protein